MRKAVALVAVVVAAGVLAACGGSPVTVPRLNTALSTTFTRLYAVQQQEEGNAPDPATYSTASCQRTGGAATGPGDDWICAVTLYRRTGLPVVATVEVKVRSNGCYVADAPLAVVGPPQLTASDGREFDNPLAEFDGCFDLT